MATEVVHWCDWHIADEDASRRLANFTHTAQLDGVTYTLELCDECEVKRYQPLALFVTTFGIDLGREQKREAQRERDRSRPPKRPRHEDDDGGTACPMPGCAFVGVNRTGLGAHGWHAHKAKGLDLLFAAAAEARA